MNLSFDATNHVPQSFDNLPAGWYPAILVEGEEKPTSKNNGDTYVASQFEIISGTGKGRKLFHNFNFKNQNEEAVRIAYDQLATIMHAVGVLKIQQFPELFNKPMQIKVALSKVVYEEDGVTVKYEARNEIKGFKAIEAAGAGAAVGGGLPEGFAAAAVSTPAATTQAASPAAPLPTATAPAPAAKERKLVMTAKANGGTAEQFKAHDAAWTDDLLVKEGYAEWIEVEAPASAPAAPTTPSSPASAPAAAAAAPAADDDTPPWLQGQ